MIGLRCYLIRFGVTGAKGRSPTNCAKNCVLIAGMDDFPQLLETTESALANIPEWPVELAVERTL